MRRALLLRGLILANGVASAAASLTLAVAPRTIPALIGITLTPMQYFPIHLLAATEAGLAVLCGVALVQQHRQTDLLVVAVLVVVHLGSILAGVVAYAGGGSPVVAINLLARLAIVIGLLVTVRTPAGGTVR